MEVFDREDNLRRVEDDLLIIQPLLLLEMEEERAASRIVKHEVQVRLTLKGIVKLENERVVNCHKNLLFELYIVDVVLLLQLRFGQDLHCVVRGAAGYALLLALMTLFHEEHFGETALPQQADHLDRPQIDLLAEVVRSVWATALDDKIEQTCALNDLLLHLLHNKVIHDVRAPIISRRDVCVGSRIRRPLYVALGGSGERSIQSLLVIVKRLRVNDRFLPLACRAADSVTAFAKAI